MGNKFDMNISLSVNVDGEDKLLHKEGYKDTRWNNLFMPSYQNPVVSALTATGTVQFSDDQLHIYNAFANKYSEDPRVKIDPETKTIQFTV